jgi:chromosome segregation ATPase
MKLYCFFAFFALLCVTGQSAQLKAWSKQRIPSLLEVSAKLKTGSPASEILEMLMKLSHNIHMDMDNDKDKQEQIRMDCELETKTLDANLVKYAETDSMLESKIDQDERALNASKKVAGGDLSKIKKCEKKVESLAGELPEGSKRIEAARKRLREIMYMLSPEEQRLGRAVNMSKQLLSNVVTTFREVERADGKASLLEVSEGANQKVGWATELTEMMSKLVKSLEDLHDNSLETLTHKRDGALRDVEYQQMKISHISQKLNRTRHKLLKIQARMTAAELKIANLTAELTQARFMLHRAKDDFRRATDSLEGAKVYCKNTEVQNSERSKQNYNRLEKVNGLIDLVQQRVDAIRRVLVAAEKIRGGTIEKLGHFKLPHQADMDSYDPKLGASGATGAATGSASGAASSSKTGSTGVNAEAV